MNREDVVAIQQRMFEVRRQAGANAHLLAYSVAGVQRLIFTSNRQRAIHASSELLLRFDAGLREERGDVIFAGGGRGLLLVADDRLTATKEDLQRRLSSMTTDVSLSLVAVPFEPARETASLRWLWQVATTRKDSAPVPRTPLPTKTGDDLCVSCNKQDGVHAAADCNIPDAAPGQSVCDSCKRLMDRGRDARRRNSHLSEVAAGNRICVLSADGNGLGQLFELLPTLESLAAVSRAVTEVFPQAVRALVQEEDDQIVAPITGGDDIRAFFSPYRMERVVPSLEQKIRAGLDRAGQALHALPNGSDLSRQLARVGLGMGLIIAPHKFPVLRLLDRANHAEDQAKDACRGRRLRSAAQLCVLISGDERTRQDPPLSLDPDASAGSEWSTLYQRVWALCHVPRSQRAALRSDLRDSDRAQPEVLNLFRYQVARSRLWQRYFEQIGTDWRLWREVDAHVPAEREQALADLLAPHAPTPALDEEVRS